MKKREVKRNIENKVLKLELTNEQIQIAVASIPEILYDDRVVTKIEFYKENRPEHLQKYLEGKNVAIDKFIDDLIILKNIGVEITNIKFKDTIYSLAKKSGIEKKELDNLGLDPEYYIGHHYDRIKQ